MKKKPILLFLLLLILALLLAACGSSGAQDPPAEAGTPSAAVEAPSGETEEAQAETDPQDAPTVSNVEAAGTALSFAERDGSVAGEYTDASGNHTSYAYSLPLVSGDTDHVAAVNKELDGIYDTYIAPELQHMDAGNSMVTDYVSWRTAECKGITSLLVYLHNDWGERAYYVYHFTADGEQVTSPALLDALGLSGEDFIRAAAEKLEEHLGPESEYKSEEIRAAMAACREKTLAPENCSAELPIYVSSYGTICFVGRVYTPAGAGYYDRLFILAPEDGFTGEELSELACDSYAASFKHRPVFAAAEEETDGAVTISLYDRPDDPGSLLDRYTVSPESGTGTDFRGNSIDLTVQ